MAPMAIELVLVIVVVAAGIALAAVISLRAGKILQSRNPTKDGAAEGVPGSQAAGAHTSTGNPAPEPQVNPAATNATSECNAAAAPAGTANAVASRDAGAEPASPGTMPFDASDLDFALPASVVDVPRTEGAAPSASPATRSAALAGATPPAGPQSLQPTEIFAKLFELALGKARPANSVTAGHLEVAEATGAALQDVATQERYAPRRPNMLPRVLSASNDDNFSARDLAALIARDPSLVGNLLKIANSSYYRVTPEPVESVDRAVVLLGTNGIRSLVTAALMQPIFRIGGADFPRFPEIAWEHTFRSASAAVPYNFLLEKSDPYAAELLSLVMGLAGIVVFRVTMDQYAKNPRLRPDAGVVSSLLDTHSANVARRISISWELSEPTIAGLDGQAITTTAYPTALGRSVYFGRLVGALAVLRISHVIDDETAKASIPVTKIPDQQLDRMWARLTHLERSTN